MLAFHMWEHARKGKDTPSYFKSTHDTPFTFNWPELSHMSTPNSKGGWECDIYARKFGVQLKTKDSFY